MSIQVGVVGLNYGAQVHLPSYRLNSKFEVAAVCARTPGKAETYAGENSVARWYTDPRQLIRSKLDLVSLASPPATHAGLAAAALASGKHVVVEIGFTLLEEDARVLVDLRRQSGRVGAAAFVLRYAPPIRLAGDWIRQGRLGGVRLMRFEHLSNYLASAPQAFRWFWDGEHGGGVLNNTIAHALDLALQWFGPVSEIHAYLGTRGPAPAAPANAALADDSGALEVTFESGVPALFSFSAAIAFARTGFEIHGAKGSLLIDGFGEELSFLPMGEIETEPLFPPEAYLEASRGRAGLLGGFTVFADQLASAIGDAPAVWPTFEDAWQVTRVIQAARLSARERRRVRINEIG